MFVLLIPFLLKGTRLRWTRPEDCRDLSHEFQYERYAVISTLAVDLSVVFNSSSSQDENICTSRDLDIWNQLRCFGVNVVSQLPHIHSSTPTSGDVHNGRNPR